MGFRSTFVTNDSSWLWPDWFREKYASSVHFPSKSGPIASMFEGKTYGIYEDIPADIQRSLNETEVLNESEFGPRDWCLVLVFLHECGCITRCEIRSTSIRWNEPTGWFTTDGVEHNYCYGCSDIPCPAER